MKVVRKIELLAPAKNLECGMAAVDHGADAVYIGAPKFGARAGASNTLEDIESLVNYAHLYQVKVYVALNTIIYDQELTEAERLIRQLYLRGVDALIIQDMGITRLNLPPIPLHASTQTDNRTPEKIKFLADAGFRQVVLARELTLDEIRQIHETTPVTLEAFVHGALCVSFSGQCYISEACFGRSANRGECAQFCRLPLNLLDADGREIAKEKHILSLKDLNLSETLEELLDAGVSSLKIEGRLKDVTYVKNVTAAYRQKLDVILKRRPEYIRSSSGTSQFIFKPQLKKSFSRGFTPYFLNGRMRNIHSFDTPKSLGEEMGRVKEIRGNYIVVAGVKNFNNGDGVCFLDEKGKLQGFRINKAEGNRVYPHAMPHILPKTIVYRNSDREFEQLLSKRSAERKINVRITLSENNFGFSLHFKDEDENEITVALPQTKEPAGIPQRENIKTQLSKLGNTPFKATEVTINLSDNWFIPASALADLRRRAVDKLLAARKINYRRELNLFHATTHKYPDNRLNYLGNISNKEAAAFYRNHGVHKIEKSYEQEKVQEAELMFCRHCIRFSMGWCKLHQKVDSPYKEPFFLQTSDGKRFKLVFDCKNCQMKVFAT